MNIADPTIFLLSRIKEKSEILEGRLLDLFWAGERRTRVMDVLPLSDLFAVLIHNSWVCNFRARRAPSPIFPNSQIWD